MTKLQNIGFIGTGIMGKSMLRNLKKAGYTMHCYARHPEKVADLAAEGVTVHSTIADCVKACQVMITIVGFPTFTIILSKLYKNHTYPGRSAPPGLFRRSAIGSRICPILLT